MAGEEGSGGQVEDQTAIHLLIEVEVEVVEAPLWVAKLGLLCPALEQAIAATSEFVGDQAGEEVDGGHRFGLSLVETGFKYGRDTAQP
jgi:hypothetical protein